MSVKQQQIQADNNAIENNSNNTNQTLVKLNDSPGRTTMRVRDSLLNLDINNTQYQQIENDYQEISRSLLQEETARNINQINNNTNTAIFSNSYHTSKSLGRKPAKFLNKLKNKKHAQIQQNNQTINYTSDISQSPRTIIQMSDHGEIKEYSKKLQNISVDNTLRAHQVYYQQFQNTPPSTIPYQQYKADKSKIQNSGNQHKKQNKGWSNQILLNLKNSGNQKVQHNKDPQQQQMKIIDGQNISQIEESVYQNVAIQEQLNQHQPHHLNPFGFNQSHSDSQQLQNQPIDDSKLDLLNHSPQTSIAHQNEQTNNYSNSFYDNLQIQTHRQHLQENSTSLYNSHLDGNSFYSNPKTTTSKMQNRYNQSELKVKQVWVNNPKYLRKEALQKQELRELFIQSTLQIGKSQDEGDQNGLQRLHTRTHKFIQESLNTARSKEQQIAIEKTHNQKTNPGQQLFIPSNMTTLNNEDKEQSNQKLYINQQSILSNFSFKGSQSTQHKNIGSVELRQRTYKPTDKQRSNKIQSFQLPDLQSQGLYGKYKSSSNRYQERLKSRDNQVYNPQLESSFINESQRIVSIDPKNIDRRNLMMMVPISQQVSIRKNNHFKQSNQDRHLSTALPQSINHNNTQRDSSYRNHSIYTSLMKNSLKDSKQIQATLISQRYPKAKPYLNKLKLTDNNFPHQMNHSTINNNNNSNYNTIFTNSSGSKPQNQSRLGTGNEYTTTQQKNNTLDKHGMSSFRRSQIDISEVKLYQQNQLANSTFTTIQRQDNDESTHQTLQNHDQDKL
eukprot:403358811